MKWLVNKKGLLLLWAATLLTTGCGGKTPLPEPVTPSLTVAPASLSLADAKATETFTVTANCDWGVSVSERDWCKVSPSGGISGTTNVTLEVQENNTYETRTATVTFRYGSQKVEVTVSQDGKEAPPPPPFIVPEGYHVVWNDEFDTDGKPNTAAWWYETGGGGWGNNEDQVYVAGSQGGVDLAYISDGSLKIQARKIGDTVYSIRMNTRESWKYGWFEARLKVSDVPGAWPAFWMMPKNFTTWPGDGEIDIMEYAISTQGKDKSSSSIHCNAYNWPKNTQKTHVQSVPQAASEYHVYALEWDQDRMRFYVDGQLHLTFNNEKKGYDTWPFDNPFYLKLNMAWGGNMGGKTDLSGLPATYEVDYVRVFQKD
jgi:Beta-glucanase/Beta-glucan synthetase